MMGMYLTQVATTRCGLCDSDGCSVAPGGIELLPMTRELELNRDGTVVMKPMTGWTTHKVAGIAVLLRIEYIESPQEFAEKHKALQLALTAPQCLELAEALTKAGKSLLEKHPGEPSH